MIHIHIPLDLTPTSLDFPPRSPTLPTLQPEEGAYATLPGTYPCYRIPEMAVMSSLIPALALATKCGVCRVLHAVKHCGHHFAGTNRHVRCLTSWKSHSLYQRRHKSRLPWQGCGNIPLQYTIFCANQVKGKLKILVLNECKQRLTE